MKNKACSECGKVGEKFNGWNHDRCVGWMEAYKAYFCIECIPGT